MPGGGGKSLIEAHPEILSGFPQWLKDLLGWILVSTFSSLFYVIPGLLLYTVIQLYYRPFVGILLALIFVYLNRKETCEWPASRKVGQILYNIFKFRTNLHEVLPLLLPKFEKRTVILAMHPHGVIPIQAILWVAFCDQFMNDMYGFGAMAPALNYIPIFRQLLGWWSGGSADFATLRRKISEGKNLYILPDGVKGIFAAHRGHDNVCMKKRRGLVRLAYKTGSVIVPLYAFGGNDLYDHLATSDGWLGRISRKYRTGITVFWGQWYLPIPYKVPMAFGFGEPVEFEQKADPSKEDLDRGFERYMKSLKDMFDRLKAEAGYSDRELALV